MQHTSTASWTVRSEAFSEKEPASFLGHIADQAIWMSEVSHHDGLQLGCSSRNGNASAKCHKNKKPARTFYFVGWIR